MTNQLPASYSIRKTTSDPLKIRTRQGCLLSLFLFNIQGVLEVLDIATGQEEIKGSQTGKEKVKLSLFADGMILYIESPKYSTKKLIELIMNSGK